MRVFILIFFCLFFKNVLFGQARMDFYYPMIDNSVSFSTGNYDTSLIRRNKVESFQHRNETYYFDSNGRLVKSVQYRTYDSTTQTHLFRYDAKGDLFETEVSNPNIPRGHHPRSYKTYKGGQLIKDSSGSGYMCKHLEYYDDGSLKQELWFGSNHSLQRGFWFGVDNSGRINRIIDREYMNKDTTGELLSNRTVFYNDKGQMIREEETVKREVNNIKSFFCPNAGSTNFFYDSFGRLVEAVRIKGPSQKIKYLDNGLIEEIETIGKNCEGTAYHSKSKYSYTYRK